MDPEERRAALIDLLQRDGRVDVGPAAARFATAEMTIRRDLDVLAARGVARRVRGGALSLVMRGEELPYSLRETESRSEKREIAAATAALIAEGESVLLDSGTTAVEVSRALAGKRLTAMPLSLHAAMVLGAAPSIRVLVPGGELRPGELAMVGPLARASIAAIRFDTAVLSCCGLAEGQVTAHDLGDAEVKRAAIAAAARVVLVADATKFARSSMGVVCAATDVDIVVTGGGAPRDALAALEADGVDVRQV